MSKITKRELVARIAEKTELTQSDVAATINTLIDELSSALSSNEEIILRNFGSFHVIKTKPRIGRNPNKPEATVEIPERAIVKFKPGKELRERVLRTLPMIED